MVSCLDCLLKLDFFLTSLFLTSWQVKALFQGKLLEKRLSLVVTKPPEVEMAVRGDPNRLRQACFL